MTQSLIEDLARYLAHHPEWHNKGYLTDTLKWHYTEKGIEKTYMAETCGRKLRLLEEAKRIAKKEIDGQSFYKFLPVERRSMYIPWSMRSDYQILFKV